MATHKQSCSVLQTTPGDSTLTDTRSKAAHHSLHAQGAMPSSSSNSMRRRSSRTTELDPLKSNEPTPVLTSHFAKVFHP
jgi:hypothetical protein